MNQTTDISGMVIRVTDGAAVFRTLLKRVEACRQSTPDKWLLIILVSGKYYYAIRDSGSDLPPVSGPLTRLTFN